MMKVLLFLCFPFCSLLSCARDPFSFITPSIGGRQSVGVFLARGVTYTIYTENQRALLIKHEELLKK